MSYYTRHELESMNFKCLGDNLKISNKASIYDCELIEIGDNSRIDDFCVISGRLEIGKNVHITPQCLVAGGEKGIVFEDFSTIAYGVKIFTQSDDYSGDTMTNSTIPTKYKNEFKKEILIGKFSIIGAGSIIMPGVTLGEGSSIGAMSLLLEDTLPWGIYVGVPAKKIKARSKGLLSLEAQYSK